jgi:hypothetical protein
MPSRLPPAFVRLLEDEGVPLERFGILEKALRPVAAERAVQLLREGGCAITGAEAWQYRHDEIVPTNDSWNIEREDYSGQDEYLRESWARAQVHVERYRGNEDILITIGF